ncbi:amino acid ABC transporter permease [Roseiflexus castenholzii]|uniref:Polar amino acid ABC transporter, inner membrane subunit n=1 Tax=Roseiflexus castenholzii (strain DSM 13941 / HLO8) TaxID=383372 RepID=A7NL92_ROSCS|nr:amino acid ABC transporter permease [Roseiflexus castenholzii]ABU58265.1 polar amino acid ABC transporter, inner membrane subunit [Roseiflexus castenholzii DSM 13941]
MHDFIDLLSRVTPDLLQGTVVTLQIAAISLILGMIVGLPVGIGRVYGPVWLQRLLGAYITLFQGTPLLIQLFTVYYGLPDVGITLGRLQAAFLTLGLNSAAYQAEYLRSALQSVSEGQMVAARAIGMSKWQAIWSVVLPQALRLALPAWSNEAIAMLKYTSVVFLIAVPDLMGQAKILASRYFAPIQIYLIVAVFYIALVGIAYLILTMIERRVRIPGLTGDVG